MHSYAGMRHSAVSHHCPVVSPTHLLIYIHVLLFAIVSGYDPAHHHVYPWLVVHVVITYYTIHVFHQYVTWLMDTDRVNLIY